MEGFGQRNSTICFKFLQDYFGYPLGNRLLVSKGNKNSDHLGGSATLQQRYNGSLNQSGSVGRKTAKSDSMLAMVPSLP